MPLFSSHTLCDLHTELGAKAPEDVLVYFVFGFDCPQDMRLNVILGYDGPVKVWLDRQPILHDPNGTNPANKDMKSIPVKAATGRHELIVALGSNSGQAWGIFVRLERPDVPARVVRQGPAAYRMPRFI
jgi:sialate O-acetylesterase